jgi:hypothetical protein
MGVNLGHGTTSSLRVEKAYRIRLFVRLCQRPFRQLDFRLRKPRLPLARANSLRQKELSPAPS